MTSDTTLSYYFDPLCGWCYASAQGLAALARTYGSRLTMKPTGLFTAPRPVSDIADHAWRNDTRIGELTGQPYSAAYHQGVMRAPGGVFSSQALTRAFALLQDIDKTLGPVFLRATQTARYVGGADTSKSPIVAELAAQTAANAGYVLDAQLLDDQLRSDTGLHRKTDQMAHDARAEMAALNITGVPHLVVHTSDGDVPISGGPLYAGGASLLDTLGQINLATV